MDYSVEDREVVVPGQKIGVSGKCDLTCFKDHEEIYSTVHGLVRQGRDYVTVIPSKGAYMPKEGDVVIGVVKSVRETFWIVDIGSPYSSYILKDEVVKTRGSVDLKQFFDVGDVISGKVSSLNEVYSHLITRPWKLEVGLIIKVNPKRIPRVIGKSRSMLEVIKSKTGSRIIVGQNGLIWLKGGKADLGVKAIRKIEAQAQTRGLTERITNFLDSESKEV